MLVIRISTGIYEKTGVHKPIISVRLDKKYFLFTVEVNGKARVAGPGAKSEPS